MKKRFLSMVLLLAFVFGMGMPAAAYGGGYDDADLELQRVDLNAGVSRVNQDFLETKDSPIVRAGILPDLYVMTITVAPLVEKKSEPGVYYQINALGRTVDCTGNKSQFADFQYSAASVTAIKNQITASWPDGSITFAGWYIESKLYLVAQYPEYIEITPSATYIGDKGTYRDNLLTSVTEYTVRGGFLEPADKADSYYHVGFSGAFYFMRSTGLSGFSYAVGLTANSDKL